jgi:DNA-binding transcriptional LysR family regulator
VLDWGDLRYLWAVSRAGSLAGAARELKVEHSTVGRRISALESALGVKLFTRGPEGLLRTKACEEIVPALDAIASQIESLERRVGGDDSRAEGLVRLTVSDAQSPFFIERLPALRERHPGLTLEILGSTRVYDLLRGEADLAIRMVDVSEPDLVSRKIARLGWALYAAPSYLERRGTPASPDDLRGHDIITAASQIARWPGARWLESRIDPGRVVLRGDSMVAMLNGCIAGMGVAMVACYLADSEARVRRVFPEICGSSDMRLVTHKDLVGVARVRAAMEFIIEIVEKERSYWSGEP